MNPISGAHIYMGIRHGQPTSRVFIAEKPESSSLNNGQIYVVLLIS